MDFDGTLCENKWPEIGEANKEMITYLKDRQANGDKIILWTCRVNDMLRKSVDWSAEKEKGGTAMNRSKFIQGLKSNIQLSEKERRRILRGTVKKYPWKLNCTIAMEEFAELQQQISKQIRGYGDKLGLLEEMADAYICLSLLESIFDIKPEELQKAMDVKFQRERERLRA